MRTIKRWVRQKLENAGYIVFNASQTGVYAQDGLYTFSNSHFVDDPRFQSAYRRGVLAGHGVDSRIQWRVHVALWAAACCKRVPGDFVECGVNAGVISSAIMEKLEWQKIEKAFVLVDTFGGPILSQFSDEEVRRGRKDVALDAVRRGAYVTDLERVKANYAEWPNVAVVQGAVPDVLERLNLDRVAFLHLDMNCAHPERAAFEYFWTRLSIGGMVLLDDYASYGYEASARAIDEGALLRGTEVLSLPTGQGLILKTSET